MPFRVGFCRRAMRKTVGFSHSLSRGRAVAARVAHNHEVAGASPAPATKSKFQITMVPEFLEIRHHFCSTPVNLVLVLLGVCYAGSMKDFVLAITGPAGSGKSTVAERIAKSFQKCVNIDVDHIKHMIVSGFYKNDKNPAGWGFNQWGLVGDSIGMLAANFLKEGYSVVINGYLDEPAWTEIEQHISISHKILLLPRLDTVVARDAERKEEYILGKESVAEHHDKFSNDRLFSAFTKLDTSNHSVDETVEEIKKVLSSSTAR